MRSEIRVALSLMAGIVVVQVARFLWLLLDAPFTILKEQDGLIASMKSGADRASVIAQLSRLWTDGTALRNRGEALMHESGVTTWWNEHLSWRNETQSAIALLDANKASQWLTLGMYTPRRTIPQAFSPMHEKRIQMFDAWLERLEALIRELLEVTD